MGTKPQQTSVENTYELRQRILRPGKRLEACKLPGDELDSSLHIILCENLETIGTSSYLLSKDPQHNETIEALNWQQMGEELQSKLNHHKVYRLRAMAIAPEYASRGYGGILLQYGLDRLKQNGTTAIWCDARENAVAFYKKMGFQIIGESYIVPEVGRHEKMWRWL